MTSNISDFPQMGAVDNSEALKTARAAAEELHNEQRVSEQSIQGEASKDVTPFKTAEKSKKIQTRGKGVAEAQKMEKLKGLFIDMAKGAAERQHKRNQEFSVEALLLLRQQIKPGSNKNDILEIVKKFYKDPTLIDEVFDFLLETTQGDLRDEVLKAKMEHYESNQSVIVAGRNIEQQVHAAIDKGLGEPVALRDEYRKFLKEAPDASTLFEQLTTRYPTYKEIKKMSAFLFHSLGADLRAELSSIEPAKLQELMTETRVLQSICQVFRFFDKRF